MSEVNSQLILAQAATAEAKARLDRIQEVMRQDIPDASVAEGLNSEIIIKLRGQYLEMAGREAIWSKKYGADHMAAVNLRTQMVELRRNINDEMRKIAESTKSDYEIASAREASIKKSLASTLSPIPASPIKRKCSSPSLRAMLRPPRPCMRIFCSATWKPFRSSLFRFPKRG